MAWTLTRKMIGALMFILFLTACTKQHDSAVIKLYVASSLMPLSDQIQRLSDKKIEFDFLSSSALAKQIEHGAACDAAIVADERWHDYLVKNNFVKESLGTIGTNSLVIASFEKMLVVHTPEEMTRVLKAAKKIVIADSAFVPLGGYTQEFLEGLGIFSALKPKFETTSSARHAALYLEQRSAPLAILYKSDALQIGSNIVAHIPPRFHRRIEYPWVACMRANRDNIALLKSVFSSPKFKAELVRKGFGLSS